MEFDITDTDTMKLIQHELDWKYDPEINEYIKDNLCAAFNVIIHKGCMYDLDSIVALERALHRSITWDEYEMINCSGVFDDLGLFNVTERHVTLINSLLAYTDELNKFIFSDD